MTAAAYRVTDALGLAAGLVGLLTACGVANDVGNDGEYTFLEGAGVVDSATYPLRRLLVVEQDAAGRALVYLFDGDLGEADVGVLDLRRIAAGFSRAAMVFALPASGFERPGASGEVVEPGSIAPSPFDVALGGVRSNLAQLGDGDALNATGAFRFLRTVTSPGIDVRAYFAVVEPSSELAQITVSAEGDDVISAATRLDAAVLSSVRDDEDEVLAVSAEGLLGADYLEVDLLQTIVRREDSALVEAIVRVSSEPTTPYTASFDLLQEATSLGCWSTAVALTLRVIQVARTYRSAAPGDPRGDWAFIHRRADAVPIAPAFWGAALAGVPAPATYCIDFESP